MHGRPPARTMCAALAAVTTAAVLAIAAQPAQAAASALSGTVLYAKSNNVYATDGVTTRQITTDGGTPAADGTGTTGYAAPSQSDDGSVVVAVRNQKLTSAGDQQTYYRGYLWVMDAYGRVIRKINPPQYAYNGGKMCNFPANAPQGIANAQVSPDGKHIAYTIRELFETFDCTAATAYRTTVVDIDGSHPVAIDDGSGTSTAAENLEIGSWASNTTLLVDRLDFGSVEVYTVPLPGPSGRAWFGPDSWTDAAYGQPAVRNGVLVTDGYSDSAMKNVVRVWSTTGFTAAPTYRCELGSTVNAGDSLGDPTLSPDGSRVAYQDTATDGTATAAGQGIYVLATTGCSSPQLLVAGGTDAFWSPAGIAPPPSVIIGSHPANPTRSTSAAIAFTVRSSGAATATCRLDGGAAQACTSPASYSRLANGVHTFTVTASDGTRSSSASYSWRVDTTAPRVTMTAPTALAIAGTAVSDNWTGSDTGSGIKSYKSQYRMARYNGAFSGWADFGPTWSPSDTRTTVSGLNAGYTYCLRVKATDKAGNVGYSPARCFAVALDDRSLARSSGWKLISGSAYYARTATTTTKKGAALTRTGVVLDRVGVVARTGRGYGTVGVYVGRTLIGKISLAASTGHYRAVLLLPRFTLRSGTVTLKVLTSGKPVTIDGLITSRS